MVFASRFRLDPAKKAGRRPTSLGTDAQGKRRAGCPQSVRSTEWAPVPCEGRGKARPHAGTGVPKRSRKTPRTKLKAEAHPAEVVEAKGRAGAGGADSSAFCEERAFFGAALCSSVAAAVCVMLAAAATGGAGPPRAGCLWVGAAAASVVFMLRCQINLSEPESPTHFPSYTIGLRI